jgi:hypothetical protein
VKLYEERNRYTYPAWEQIRQLACQYRESAGRPDGRDLDYWLMAEAEILNRTIPVEAPGGED